MMMGSANVARGWYSRFVRHGENDPGDPGNRGDHAVEDESENEDFKGSAAQSGKQIREIHSGEIVAEGEKAPTEQRGSEHAPGMREKSENRDQHDHAKNGAANIVAKRGHRFQRRQTIRHEQRGEHHQYQKAPSEQADAQRREGVKNTHPRPVGLWRVHGFSVSYSFVLGGLTLTEELGALSFPNLATTE